MKKLNYQFVSGSIGIILMIESAFMLISAFIGEIYGELSSKSLYLSALITFIAGGLLLLTGRSKKDQNRRISQREVYLTVTLTWALMALFGTLPYLIDDAIPAFADALFESVCGFTTTGSSTLLNIEAFPKSLLFWRSFTQWIGGIGIIIFVISLLHVFDGGASHLYSAEATGISKDQLRMRINDITRTASLTYIALTFIGFLLLWAGPMDAFDAACHAFTSISTGGFSTKQASLAYFNSAYIEYVIVFLMFAGGTRFILLFYIFRNFSFQIFKDEEFRWYSLLIIGFTVLIIGTLYLAGNAPGGAEKTARTVLFQVVSAITSTGFATTDFLQWGQFYWFLFLAMILFCGSEGSTSGGMKISRLIILVKNTSVVLRRQVHPKAIYAVKINGQVFSNTVVEKVLAFVFLYLTICGVSAIILSFNGLSFDESLGVAVSSMSSYGFGLGSYGPSGSFATLNVFSKYYLSFLMIVGRLEVFTVLSLFFPGFWKR